MNWTLVITVLIVVAGFVTVWIYDLRFRHAYIQTFRDTYCPKKDQWDTWTIKPMQVEVKTDHTVVVPKKAVRKRAH